MKPDAATVQALSAQAVDLLCRLIAIPSFSREEADTAALIDAFLQEKGVSSLIIICKQGIDRSAGEKLRRVERKIPLIDN